MNSTQWCARLSRYDLPITSPNNINTFSSTKVRRIQKASTEGQSVSKPQLQRQRECCLTKRLPNRTMAMLAVRLEPKERLRRTLGPCTCVTKIGRFLRQSISKIQREMTKFYVLGERKPQCAVSFLSNTVLDIQF